MRFASLQGSSNGAKYAAAGKAVADSSANVFDVQRKTGPDYAGISKTAMKTAAEEKIAGMRAEASVAQAGIKAVTGVKQSAIKTEVFKKGEEIKNKQRKAGGLAAIGKMAGAGFLAATDNTKGRERPKADYQGLFDKSKAERTALKERQKAEADAHGTFTAEPFKPSTGVSSSQSSSGTGNNTFNLSKVIRYAEGTLGDSGYNTMFTGRQFNDTTKHPRQINSGGGFSSDAAGAYQFLSPTWDRAKNALNLPDFSPASQERAGAYLAQQRGVDTSRVYANIDEFKTDIDKLAPEWASLPTAATGTSYYGQGGKTIEDLWRVYQGG
ncbi:MAG: glycoside hydrolase family 104 protein [Rhodobacteraceae bacterium]|nr:glycoside hydrolase family 104 protein [Paracoccaceae bacterium]